jgi:hypothetical protein
MKKILLLTACVLAAMAIMLLFQNQNKKHDKRFVHASKVKTDKNDADAVGMVEYFSKLLIDPATGQMDLAAYYNDMNQATSLMAASRAAASNLGLQWNFIGPDNIGGRTRAILFDKNNTNTVFAAGVTGGLWISGDGGQSWVEWSGSDQLQNMCIVSICQDDSGYIYFGTGEGCSGLLGGYGEVAQAFVGYGVWKSTTPTSPTNPTSINFAHLSSTTPSSTLDPTVNWEETNRLAANPHFPDSILAATVGGIMVSADGGNKWKPANGITGGMGTDVKYSIDGKKVFASVNSSTDYGSNATFYYSTNGGASFKKMNGVGGFPKSDESGDFFARIEFGVSPTTPNYAYAALINLGGSNYGSVAYVVRTSNGGATWDTIGIGSGVNNYYNNNGFDPTNYQGVYDIAVGVSPVDSNTIFVGGTVLYRWTPTEGWEQIAFYGEDEFNNTLHADIHALLFDPSNSSRLIIGSDGGVSQSLNPYSTNTTTGVLFTSLNRNYDVTQYYTVAADSEGRTIGGTQDNSDEYINFLGNTDLSATQVLGGDGGTTQITSNNDFFASIPGDIHAYRSITRANSWAQFYDSLITAAANSIGAQFVLPFNIWEDQDSLRYFDSIGLPPKQSLCAVGLGSQGPGSTGEVWVTISALNPVESTPDWFYIGAVGGDVTVVKFSPDGQCLYVGTDAGNIYRYSGFDSVFKENGWKYPTVGLKTIYTWNAADSGILAVHSSYTGFSGRQITSISVDPNNYNNVVVTAANYGDYANYIATSTDATTSFTFSSAQGSGATALPLGPVFSSCMPIGAPSGTILAGTQYGIWSSQNFGNTWAFDNNGLADVAIMSIRQEPYYNSSALYVASYGRGLWTSYTLTNPTGINIVKGQTVNNLNVFPNPLSGTGHIQYTLAKEGNVVINLYDITGKLVRNIADENMIAGPVNIQFNAADLVSGTYIVEVIQGQNRSTAKLAVLH